MTLPDHMKVVEIAAPGGPEVLRVAERPVPRPGPGEIVIRVAAAGVNRPDCLQRAGAYAPPPDASDLPGLECSGHVAAVGEGVTRWAEGDAVCALLPGGGYAEYALTHADHALPVPAGFSMTEAAGLCETLFTVWGNVFRRGRLDRGKTLLVHGGSSGIGTTAIQLAHLRGARVLATAGSAEKCALCRELGAERAINYREEDFVAAVHEATEGRGADVILDMVGGDYVQRNLKALAEDGRLVQIAFLKGARVELNLAPLMLRRQTITGSTLRPQSVAAKAALARDLETEVWPLLAGGRMKVVVHEVLPLAQAAEAHALMESSAHMGKIILSVRDGG